MGIYLSISTADPKLDAESIMIRHYKSNSGDAIQKLIAIL